MQIYVQNIRFFDEVSPKLEEQLAAMQTLGMRYLCPRNVNGKNIAQYSLQSFRQDVKPALLKQGVQLSSIGSPIGKIDLTDEKAYQAQLKQLRELLAIAQEMECAYIRVFSFFTAKVRGRIVCWSAWRKGERLPEAGGGQRRHPDP